MNYSPEEAKFYIVELPMSVDETLARLYGSARPALRDHPVRVNAHLKEGRIQPGQMVVLTPSGSGACQQ